MICLKYKKGIGAMIAISLFFIVSILSYMYLQDWFYLYKSDFDAVISSKDYDRNIEIVKIDGTDIYIKNDFKEGLELNSIQINGKECILHNITLSKGLKKIDIGGCTEGTENLQAYDVYVTTDHGIKIERELIRNIVDSAFVIKFQMGPCDFSSNYVRLYGLSDFDNAHADIDGSGTYNVCVRHLDYNVGTSSIGNFKNLFYLTEQNNSAVWTDKGSIYQEPAQWHEILLSSSGGSFSLNVSSSDLSASNYKCIGKINEDNVYGSHIGNCDSSMPHTIWVKLE